MKKRVVAITLILLVLIIPMHTSLVFGDIDVSVSGEDGIDGFIKANDVITVIANVSDATRDLSKDNVKLGPNQINVEDFDVCSPAQGREITCTFSDNIRLNDDETDDRPIDNNPPQQRFYVIIFDGDEPVSSKQVFYDVDYLGPEITPKTGEPLAEQTDGNVTLNLIIKDWAFQLGPNNPSHFTGIKKIIIDNTDFEINTDDQEYSETIKVIISGEDDEAKTLSLKAVDKLGNTGTAVTTNAFVFDNTAPTIDEFKILKSDGVTEITSIAKEGPYSQKNDAKIKVEGEDMSGVRLVADLSGLNTNAGLGYENQEVTCTKTPETDKYTCIISGINIKLNDGTETVKLTVIDNFNHATERTFSHGITIDVSNPRVIELGSYYRYGETYYVRKQDNTLLAVFDEDSAMDPANVFLLIGESSDKLPADECNESTTTWTCYWHNQEITGNHGEAVTLSLHADSRDAAGNNIAETRSAELFIDEEDPVEKSVKVFSWGEEGSQDIEEIVIGEMLEAKAEIIDDSRIQAYADFSELLDDEQYTPEWIDCEISQTEDNRWICHWPDMGIVSALVGKKDLNFIFRDSVNNSINVKKTVDVFEKEGEFKEYWLKPKVENPQYPISVESLNYINHRAFAKVELKPNPNTPGVEPVRIVIDDCRPDDSVSYLKDTGDNPYCMNCDFNVNDLYLKFTFRKQRAEDLFNLPFNCSLRITSKYNTGTTQVITQEQVLGVKFDIPFSDRMAAIEDAVEDEIESIKGSWLLSNDILDNLIKIYDIANKICTFLQLFITIAHTLAKVEMIFRYFTDSNPVTYKYGVLMGETSGRVADIANKLDGWFRKFCYFLSCKGGGFLANMWGPDLASTEEKLRTNSAAANIWHGKGLSSDSVADIMEPQKSLIVSLRYGCLPGIIANLKRARNIECAYVSCLKDQVAAGAPISVCTTTRSFLYCQYVYGEIFHIFPLLNAWTQFTQQLLELLANPEAALISAVLTTVCEPGVATGPVHALCVAAQMMKTITSLTELQDRIKETNKWLDQDEDICAEALA